MFYRPANTDGAWFLKITLGSGHSPKSVAASVPKVTRTFKKTRPVKLFVIVTLK